MTILVTGAAGFIGFHLAQRLAQQGRAVVGLDNINDYYDVTLKEARLRELAKLANFRFIRADIAHENELAAAFDLADYEAIVHLAAQAGGRYSLINPQAYVRSNLDGFVNVLEACRHRKVAHLVYASSSSVYGAVTAMPFSVHQNVDHPVSLYGATKKANELMAHSYSHLFGLPTTGLRFFTVYGPWGRPDMAVWSFADAIFEGRSIKLFNEGNMLRDVTYIDDSVDAVFRLVERAPGNSPQGSSADPDTARSSAPWRIYNIGNSSPVDVMRLVSVLESLLGRIATKEMLPMQPGDMLATYADVDDLM